MVERFVENCVEPHKAHFSVPSSWTSWLAKRGLADGTESSRTRGVWLLTSRGSSLTASVFHVFAATRNLRGIARELGAGHPALGLVQVLQAHA